MPDPQVSALAIPGIFVKVPMGSSGLEGDRACSMNPANDTLSFEANMSFNLSPEDVLNIDGKTSKGD